MADTKRTIAYLLASIFQDGQVANSITAQDMRDLTISMQPSHGGYSEATPAATNVVIAGTYYKAAGTTTADADAQDTTAATDNKLIYTGAPARHFIVSASITLTAGSNNQVVGVKLAKNGAVIDETVARRKINATTDVGALPLVAHVDLSTGDYIEVWLTNETSTGSVITVSNIHLQATGFAI